MTAWVTFSGIFVFLIVFDSYFMNSKAEHLTVGRAMLCTLFWFAMAFCFCGCVWIWLRGD